MPSTANKPLPTAAGAAPKCRICESKLDPEEQDDMENHVCYSCKDRPEARRLGIKVLPWSAEDAGKLHSMAEGKAKAARELMPAEISLIRKVHSYMPIQQLLDILNERLACDLGPDAMPYTVDMVTAEIEKISGSAAPAGGHDWASLRKLLSKAERSGVLQRVSEQTINDFAVVYSLNQKQLHVLKEIILEAKEG